MRGNPKFSPLLMPVRPKRRCRSKNAKGCQNFETNLFISDDSALLLPNLREFGDKLTEIDAVLGDMQNSRFLTNYLLYLGNKARQIVEREREPFTEFR